MRSGISLAAVGIRLWGGHRITSVNRRRSQAPIWSVRGAAPNQWGTASVPAAPSRPLRRCSGQRQLLDTLRTDCETSAAMRASETFLRIVVDPASEARYATMDQCTHIGNFLHSVLRRH